MKLTKTILGNEYEYNEYDICYGFHLFETIMLDEGGNIHYDVTYDDNHYTPIEFGNIQNNDKCEYEHNGFCIVSCPTGNHYWKKRYSTCQEMCSFCPKKKYPGIKGRKQNIHLNLKRMAWIDKMKEQGKKWFNKDYLLTRDEAFNSEGW